MRLVMNPTNSDKMHRCAVYFFIVCVTITFTCCKQSKSSKSSIEAQPFLAQALRLQQALLFLGSPMSDEDVQRLQQLREQEPDSNTVNIIQQILDPYCIAHITISPEARVSVTKGKAKAELIQHGWKTFLVKVHNQAAVTAPLEVESANAKPIMHGSQNDHRPKPQHALTPGEIANRFIDVAMYRNRPLDPNLSGLALEYAVVQIYTKDDGQREVELGFHVGQGTQDIGFRNAINVLFNCLPSVKVVFDVEDDDGSPTMGSFIITDKIERVIVPETAREARSVNYRITSAQNEFGVLSKQ